MHHHLSTDQIAENRVDVENQHTLIFRDYCLCYHMGIYHFEFVIRSKEKNNSN